MSYKDECGELRADTGDYYKALLFSMKLLVEGNFFEKDMERVGMGDCINQFKKYKCVLNKQLEVKMKMMGFHNEIDIVHLEQVTEEFLDVWHKTYPLMYDAIAQMEMHNNRS